MRKYSFWVIGWAVVALGAALCAAETNLEMRQNLDEQFRRADAALNEVYKEVMDAQGEKQQEALRQGQRAWIRYRDACVASEGSMYEGGSIQPVIQLQCALDLTVAQTERLRALMPKAVAARQTDAPDTTGLEVVREQAAAHMQKVFSDFTSSNVAPEVVDVQKAWEAFCDAWVTAETACHPDDAAKAAKEECLAVLNRERAERLKQLFMEGYREEEEAPETNDLAFADPPLMKAAAANDLDTVKRLIERGANVNEVNDADWTALHVAAEQGNPGIVTLLLNAGARKDLGDFDARTAADVAREVNKPDIARMIEQHGAPSAEQKPPEQPASAVVTEAKDETQAQDLERLLQEFGGLTDLRQEEWNRDNEWKRVVTARGEVSEVNSTGFFSEISDAEYEVTCELRSGDRAVLYMDKNNSDFVHNLEIGDTITFTGKLKNIQDWGFWRSGYVKVD